MSAMEDMFTKMLPAMLPGILEKLLGPHMPEVVEKIKEGLAQLSSFDQRLTDIKQGQDDLRYLLNSAKNGGPSWGERLALGQGMIVDQAPMDQMIREAGAYYDRCDDFDEQPRLFIGASDRGGSDSLSDSGRHDSAGG